MRVLAVPLITLSLAALACGGGTPEGPKNAPTSTPGDRSTKDVASTDQDAPSGPRKPSCSDGSCFTCGDGICPAGFYCETSRVGTGCAWASTCNGKSSCACLGSAVKGCDCQDDGDIARVSCK